LTEVLNMAQPTLNAAAAIGVELEKVRDSVYPF